MDVLSVKFDNCYGIKHLDFTFKFSCSKTMLIYAPNGMMKSSFATTFDNYSKSNVKEVRDRIANLPGTVTINADGQALQPERAFVADGGNKNFDASSKINTFVARADLKKKYQQIVEALNEKKTAFLTNLKRISSSKDCEAEFVDAFRENKNSTFLSCLASIETLLKKEHQFFDFKYNDVFDKKGEVKKFVKENLGTINTYASCYKKLLSESSFFHMTSGNKVFGTYQAKQLSDSVKDGAFFGASHKLILKDGSSIETANALNERYETEINAIFNDESLKSQFNSLDTKLDKNAGLRGFKDVLRQHQEIIPQLQDYDLFRKEVWYGYVGKIAAEARDLICEYNTKSTEIKQILLEAQDEVETWRHIIKIYKARFYVPFDIVIENQEDLLLKDKSIAMLRFVYKNSTEKKEKDELYPILSTGERRALNILQIIFELESRKSKSEESVVIYDDIADSFDYKNKYAIVEYIRDSVESGKFNNIILTHNFDFYRTIASRLSLPRKNSVYMATNDGNGNISLKDGQYRKDLFSYFCKKAQNDKIFVSLIPFVRNLIEYTEGKDSSEYMDLTSCLHIKHGITDSKTVNDIAMVYRQFSACAGLTNARSSENVKDYILSVAAALNGEHDIDEVLIENKIVFSIAIRLKAEEFMIREILANGETQEKIDKIDSNQTKTLYSMYQQRRPSEKQKIELLDEVNIMTPESIHLNSFMYEPLIDMSVFQLKDLYQKCLTQLI